MNGIKYLKNKPEKMKIKKLWFNDNKIFIITGDGKELWQSLLWYRRLQHASDVQRNNYRISHSGIHWPDIDEDISFESFTYDDPEPVGIARIFREHPEINVSEVARRMKLPQSLLAAYSSGAKKPSKKRTKEIEQELHQIGRKLSLIQL
jgi:hypothetical protein